MKVILTGLPHFNRRTAAFLARHGSAHDRYVVVEETSSWRGRLRFLLELVRADAVFAYWGTLRRSRALAIALRLRKRVVQFWAGTDVLDALDAARAGQAYAPLVDRCVHLCESEWTRDELASAGIRAGVVPLAALDAPPAASEIALPATFSVLAYAGAPREDFYRLPELVALAQAFPRVPFAICGTDGSSLGGEAPPNVAFLGWVDDVAALYRTATVFVRIPEHDGCSFSVREALAWGRYVVASYPYPRCFVGADRDAIAPHLAALERRHREGTLPPNLSGREFVLAEYDEASVYARLRPFLGPAR